jgi:N-methylhydantoinase B/oxoprolinase/acetone carboxylase alpha subunit
MTAEAPARAESALHGIDPVTFEVIRHRLWAINDDQARMGARLSGSPIIYEGYDFNASLTTGDGRALYCGVYILHHGATIDEFIRRILDTWPREEIREGDMFFTNDPWWGALHANDGILVAPIFWERALVAWSGIVMHDDDVGGPIPGSVGAGATNRFEEAPLVPGVKIVEGFQPRRDVERAFLRNSRTAERNALNMRARVAALRTTYRRIGELVDQYGIDTFRAAQDGIIEYVECVVRRRLAEIPDGSWYAEGYHDHDGNEGRVYRICCRLTKREDHLTVDMTGTSSQAAGPVNCTRPALEGAVVGIVLTMLCYDLPWTIASIRNVTEIVSEEGTLNNAVSPAAVGMASFMVTLSTMDVVGHAFAKMLLSSDRYRTEAQATWSPGISIDMLITQEVDRDPAMLLVTDCFGGGGGARTFADGINSGGLFHSMACRVSNAEALEARGSMLHLYRRELTDAGGAGRYRGGVGIEFATVTHKLHADAALVSSMSSGVYMPGGHGLSGGAPGAAAYHLICRDTAVDEMLAAGEIPTAVDELGAGSIEVLEPKALAPLRAGDVLVGVVANGSGVGDPLRRDPAATLADVRDGLVSETMARAAYGVVLRDGAVDEDATAREREAIRTRRMQDGRAADPEAGGGTVDGGIVLHPVSETVEAVERDGECSLRCTECHYRFGPYEHDHTRSALMRELPLTVLSPHNRLCKEQYVAREFSCPGCGTALAFDVQDRDEPILPGSSFAAGRGETPRRRSR